MNFKLYLEMMFDCGNIYINYDNSKQSDELIATVLWDELKQTTYIKTNGENLQNYICNWDCYCCFIKLVDEATDNLITINKKRPQ